MKQRTITDIFFIISFTLVIALIISTSKLSGYEENYLEANGEVFDRDWTTASEKVNRDTMGQYFLDSQNIIIYTKGRFIREVRKTCEHESAHLIWYREFNESQRSEWELLFNNSVSDKYMNDSERVKLLFNESEKFVSRYAEKNVVEDFAESYEYWVFKLNKLSKEKEEFMEKYVEGLI